MKHGNPETNARSLDLLSATALVIASMIGTGVFTTSGFLLKDLGSPWAVLLAWVAGGVLAALGALCYGALARHIPESGGEYLFLSRTLHPAAGYVAGWISLLVGFSAPLAAVAYGFGEYAKPWLAGCAPKWSGTLILLIFAVVHAGHVRRGARLQDWIVVIKVVMILLLIGFAAPRLVFASATPLDQVSFSALGVSVVWVSFSYSGWNAAVYIGGEIADPARNLPRSLLLGTGLVTVLYLALNTVFVFSAPVSELAGKLEIGRVAAQALGGPALANIVTAVVVLALATSVSSMVMAGPRVYAQMARDGYLPRWLAPAEGPPRAAIALQCALALTLLWSTTYETLLTYIGFTLGLSTAATVLGLVWLKLRRLAGLEVPGWPWVPAAFIAGVGAICGFTVVRRPVESLYGLLTMAVGVLAWRLQTGSSRSARPPSRS